LVAEKAAGSQVRVVSVSIGVCQAVHWLAVETAL
jgi:hypothetical protein